MFGGIFVCFCMVVCMIFAMAIICPNRGGQISGGGSVVYVDDGYRPHHEIVVVEEHVEVVDGYHPYEGETVVVEERGYYEGEHFEETVEVEEHQEGY